ncbi:proline dehydrogenase-like protein [Truncatella angustata]|uniref:Proline dehydrogenase n=1 Tax=Truncatella angustata TaxID=152316 RepID=A0A9P8UGF1_9PEZI|nr:proline dehydrogenase-like protein [Truncatella angustata]KAH6651668.1 proline dehydrogenase-like protein [Truncatella angustata]
MEKKIAPLSVLPLPTVLRTLATTTISSSPLLLPPSLMAMNVLAHTQNPILNPDKNPVLGWFLKKTFYAQFCAGENAPEVRRTVDGLRKIGFTGVILGYAKEVVLSKSQTENLTACDTGADKDECVQHEISPWASGTMETVRLAQQGDFVSLKFTGAGRQALYALKNRLPPPKELRAAIDAVCDLARERNIPLLFDAEQTALQSGIDDWTLEYQKKYNTVPGHALIYGTYQAYLKACPAVLGSHLAAAAKEGFTLGVKLVRGAYLGADPRHIIHDTKEDTDKCYDGISESLIRREWNDVLSQDAKYPLVSLLIASHNLDSVRHARAIRPVGELAMAQLQGMADEVSCELVCVKKKDDKVSGDSTRAYKYLVWGTTGECMKYLLRRANENKDAVGRTRSGRDAMWGEVKRRFWTSLGRA